MRFKGGQSLALNLFLNRNILDLEEEIKNTIKNALVDRRFELHLLPRGAIQSDGQVVERLALRGVAPRTAAQSLVARFRPLYAGGVLAAREPPPQMLTVILNHTPCRANA